MVQVYREPLCRRHYCGLASGSSLLRVCVLGGSIVLSFLLAYGTGGFWPKVRWELEQAEVHYTGDGLAVIEGATAGSERIWSSSPELQELAGDSAGAATVQVGEIDSNQDGLPDIIHFTARMAGAAPVHSVKLLLQFSYRLRGAARLKMRGLALVTAASPLPGAALHVDGQLELRQAAPLGRGTYSAAYDTPLLGPGVAATGASQAEALLDLPALLSRYAARNATTAFNPSSAVWTAAGGGADEFLIDVRVRVPPHQTLLYRPTLGESLKWGWVQFLAAFAALWWLAARFEAAVFGLRLLPTRVVSDAAPPSKGAR